MSENLRWYTKALYGMDHVVRLVPDDGWDRLSPCEGWTARHVIGHVIAIQRYMLAVIQGVEPTMDPMTEPNRHAGDDPAATWAAARDDILAALDHEGVLHRVVKTFRGEQQIDEMIGSNVADTTIHTWDLARAADVDDRLDPGLVARACELILPVADDMRRPMVFGPRVDPPAGADAQTVLLAATGRRDDGDLGLGFDVVETRTEAIADDGTVIEDDLIELVDADGNVVATDETTVMVEPDGTTVIDEVISVVDDSGELVEVDGATVIIEPDA